MPYCRACGVRTEVGDTCPKCSQNQSAQTPASVQGFAELYLDPPRLISATLGRLDLNFALMLFGGAFGLQLIGQILLYSVVYSRFDGKAVMLNLVGWLLTNGAWVGGLVFAAGKLGRPHRWESVLGAVGAILIPLGVLAAFRGILPGRASIIANAIDYIPALLFWVGLWFICQRMADGDQKRTAKLLLLAGALPGAMEAFWSLYRVFVIK